MKTQMLVLIHQDKCEIISSSQKTGARYLQELLDAGWTIKQISSVMQQGSTDQSWCWVLLEK